MQQVGCTRGKNNLQEGGKKLPMEKLCALDKIRAWLAKTVYPNTSQGSLCCLSTDLALGQKASSTPSKLIFSYLQSNLTVTVNFLNATWKLLREAWKKGGEGGKKKFIKSSREYGQNCFHVWCRGTAWAEICGLPRVWPLEVVPVYRRKSISL